VIALAVVSAVLVLFVLFGLCLCLGAVSGRADAMATRIFESITRESPVPVSGADGDEGEPGTIVLGRFPGPRSTYGQGVEGVERLERRRIALREPRPSDPRLN
jgi:hypothetical protein